MILTGRRIMFAIITIGLVANPVASYELEKSCNQTAGWPEHSSTNHHTDLSVSINGTCINIHCITPLS